MFLAMAPSNCPAAAGPDSGDWPPHLAEIQPRRLQTFDDEWRKWQADPDNYTPPTEGD